MLPASTRLTRREDFAKAVRRGRRTARRTLVVHLARAGEMDQAYPKVGFVVARTVGGAVVRHRVQRQLRHLMRSRLDTLPPGALVVVRALPAAAGRDSVVLGDDLDAALRRLRHSPADARSPAAPAGSRPASGSARGGRR